MISSQPHYDHFDTLPSLFCLNALRKLGRHHRIHLTVKLVNLYKQRLLWSFASNKPTRFQSANSSCQRQHHAKHTSHTLSMRIISQRQAIFKNFIFCHLQVCRITIPVLRPRKKQCENEPSMMLSHRAKF